MSDQGLSRVLGNSAADLQGNRAGQLTRTQIRRLWRDAGISAGTLAFLSAGALSAGWSLVMWWRPDIGLPSVLLSIVVALAGLLLIAGAGLLGWQLVQLVLDISAGQVETRAGAIHKAISRGSRGTPSYTLELDGQAYGVAPALHRVLNEGERYRVYYTPKAKRVVAVEAAEQQR